MERETSEYKGFLEPGERLDDLECNGLKLIQHPDKFCFGMDAVLLSSFVRADAAQRVIDLGTGTGVIPILLSTKIKAREIVGLEIQEDMAKMATRSVEWNQLLNRVKILHGDIRKVRDMFAAGSFQIVVSNPPYMKEDSGIINPSDALSIARHERSCNLEDLMQATSYLLNESGRLFLVHRPNRLIDIVDAMKRHRLEPKRMVFVHPYVTKSPNMVLIEARKGGGSFLQIDPPLIVYERPGVYTEQILQKYGKV